MSIVQDYQEQANQLYKGAALAPMVRASTTPLRLLALDYGADWVYSEELVDRSLSQTIRIENHDLGTIDYVKDTSKLPAKTQRRLAKEQRSCLIFRIDPQKESKKLVCQLGTGEPELALPAAKHIYRDVSAIDINMGCPKKFSVSGGMGSALLNDPDRARRILTTLRKEIPRPISCKIRLLETTQATVEFVEGMIQAGANAVAIHARRVGHEATIAADWKTLEEVLGLLRPKYPGFPFLVNGDFYNRQETNDMLEKTKASGVLLGRPALYNTSIFFPASTPLLDKTQVVQDYLQKTVQYDTHYKNSKYVICEMMTHRRSPVYRVSDLPIQFAGGQTVAKVCACSSLPQLCELWNVDYSQAVGLRASARSGELSNGISKEASLPTALAPGEHRYEDSYFLKHHMDPLSSAKVQKTLPEAKRARVDPAEEKKENTEEPSSKNTCKDVQDATKD